MNARANTEEAASRRLVVSSLSPRGLNSTTAARICGDETFTPAFTEKNQS
jgi:hypothetical protein